MERQEKEMYNISIHSAARAETAAKGPGEVQAGISIHSAARAETHIFYTDGWDTIISIHSAARAETVPQWYPVMRGM